MENINMNISLTSIFQELLIDTNIIFVALLDREIANAYVTDRILQYSDEQGSIKRGISLYNQKCHSS